MSCDWTACVDYTDNGILFADKMKVLTDNLKKSGELETRTKANLKSPGYEL